MQCMPGTMSAAAMHQAEDLSDGCRSASPRASALRRIVTLDIGPAMTDKDSHDLDELVAAYPRLFRGRPPAIPGYIGHGWHSTVMELFAAIDALLIDAHARLEVIQIKEKFGALRIYVRLRRQPRRLVAPPSAARPVATRVLYDAISELIDFAEQRSRCTCERCGAPGALRTSGWMVTLCDRHAGQVDGPSSISADEGAAPADGS
jgi:hypothetical protein